jgi:uncharacterized membrane protein (GlpM family)
MNTNELVDVKSLSKDELKAHVWGSIRKGLPLFLVNVFSVIAYLSILYALCQLLIVNESKVIAFLDYYNIFKMKSFSKFIFYLLGCYLFVAGFFKIRNSIKKLIIH